jgi:dienelactone hydrolase
MMRFVSGTLLFLVAQPPLCPAQSEALEWARVLPKGSIPEDARLGPPRRVTEGANFKPYADRATWEARVRTLREKALVAAGLWPMPAKGPLHATVTSVVDGGDYTIENLYFASHPGHYVSASLYRPKGKGPFPAVLSAHGHAKLGRLAEASLKTRDGKPNPDPWPYQARGVALARLGAIALLYDMVGYADSKQVRHPTDAPKVRVPEGTDDFEGLDCEMHCLSTLGLQTWNSVRAVDYLLSRNDVDPKRIAISGASGGATQTLMLMMTDDRVAAAAPVCMVSTGFQGDCTCEQAALSKIGTDTVEYSAAFAPRPLIVVGATGDWTKEIIEKGGPEIRATYELMGAADRVQVVRYEAPHNYNRKSREAVHEFLNQWLNLGHVGPITEQPFDAIPPSRLHVYTDSFPLPKDALDAPALKRSLILAGRKQIESLRPTDAESLTEYRRIVGTALRHMVASELPTAKQLRVKILGNVSRTAFVAERMLLSRVENGEQVPALLLSPRNPSGDIVVLVHPEGKFGMLDKSGEPGPLVGEMLAAGQSVLLLDPFLTGEYHRPDRRTPAPDAKIGFFACFNRTLLAQRVHDILTALTVARDRAGTKRVHLVGVGDAGVWCLLARGLAGDTVSRTALELGPSFADVSDVTHPLYLPGALRYGDVGGLALLCAPHDLMLSRTKSFDTAPLRDAYRAAEMLDRLNLVEKTSAAQMVEWLGK